MGAGPGQSRRVGEQHEFNERDAIDAALIRLYRATRDPRRLETLLRRFDPLLFSVVGPYVAVDEAFEDVAQFGLLGFLEALETYDRTAGVGFATFARSRVVAEIEARSVASAPASRARRARKVLQRRARDARRRTPAASDAGLAASLGVPLDELLDAQQARPGRRGPLRPDGTPEPGEGATAAGLEHVALEDEVDVALTILGPRDVEALPLRFVDDRRLGELLGRTGELPTEVLRVLNRALGRIREDLEAHLGSAHHDDPTLPAR